MKTIEFPDYATAFDKCRHIDKPLVVKVGEEITRIFPSGSYQPINYQKEREDGRVGNGV
jgi:hypothetical protein